MKALKILVISDKETKESIGNLLLKSKDREVVVLTTEQVKKISIDVFNTFDYVLLDLHLKFPICAHYVIQERCGWFDGKELHYKDPLNTVKSRGDLQYIEEKKQEALNSGEKVFELWAIPIPNPNPKKDVSYSVNEEEIGSLFSSRS